MKRLLKNTHLLFWGFIPIFLLYGFLNYKEAIDINIHDTMFVIATLHFMVFISIIFFVIGFTYYNSYKKGKLKLNNSLTVLHTIITIAGLLLVFIFSFKSFSQVGWHSDVSKYMLYENYKLLTIFIIVLVQLLFIFNFISGIFIRK